MRQKSRPERAPAEQVVKDIRRATRRHFSAEDKIRIVLEGLRGEDSIAWKLCLIHFPVGALGSTPNAPLAARFSLQVQDRLQAQDCTQPLVD